MDAQAIHDRLAAKFGERVTAFQADALQPWTVVAADAIAEVAAFAKADPDLAFDNLMCLAARPTTRQGDAAADGAGLPPVSRTRTATCTCSR